VLLALSFPGFDYPVLGWIALAPLLVALEGTSLIRAFFLGLTTGVLYFSGTLYWITLVMVVYGGLPTWVAVLVNALLVAYLALFPALFAVVVRRIVVKLGPPALMAAPLVWVATELGRTHVFGGFPWVLLGYNQASVLPIAQLASVFGVYGVSALVSSVSAGLAAFGLGMGRRPTGVGRRARWVALLAPLALVTAVAVWGNARVSAADLTRAGQAVRVGLIQGNVDQGQKWNPAGAAAIFGDYLRMTRQAIAEGAEFVVWPESSTPFFFEEDRSDAEQVRAIARQAGVPILLGSDQIDHGPPEKYYNSAFLVRADGTTAGAYRKIHLVPFGEYVPLRPVLFFAARLVQAIPGDFSAGDAAVLLPVNGHFVSTAICYEIVYPALVRRFVAGGSELLTTITNDAWFGRTSAPYQHFEQASMRAIENGRYLVRSANTGISGVVDPYGRVVAQSRIFEQAVIVSQARFLRTSTFYARHGDVFAYASALAAVAMLVFGPGSRRKM
jgi:apolipoprotein N-acyltransferase